MNADPQTDRYRKRPVEITAVQWRGESNCQEVFDFLGLEHPDDEMDHSVIHIDTLEGTMTAQQGDWIVRGVKGEFYVVATARHTESGERLVIYRSGDDWWCRPVSSFTSDVTVDGETRPRFAPAADARQQRECSASISGYCLRESQSETACDTEDGECVYGGRPGAEAQQQPDTETPDALATARATNQRLNLRAQRLESELAAYRRAVNQWKVSERGTYIPHSSLRTIGKACGVDILGSVRHLKHFERVEQAEAAIARVRQLHDRLTEETDLTSPDDPITRGAAAKRIAAALDGWTPPAVSGPGAADDKQDGAA